MPAVPFTAVLRRAGFQPALFRGPRNNAGWKPFEAQDEPALRYAIRIASPQACTSHADGLHMNPKPAMLTRLIHFISGLTRSRYTRALEDELARLRAENRALLNSILGIAGIPPLRLDAELARDQRIAAAAAPARHATPHPTSHPAPRTIVPPASAIARGSAARADSPAASSASGASAASARAPRPNRLILPANALRRRSWQQIGRMLEIADARRLSHRDNSGAMS